MPVGSAMTEGGRIEPEPNFKVADIRSNRAGSNWLPNEEEAEERFAGGPLRGGLPTGFACGSFFPVFFGTLAGGPINFAGEGKDGN